MPTASDYLTTAHLNACKRLAELDTVPLDQRARFTHTGSDGVTYDWTGYRKALLDEVAALNGLIQQTAGPYTVIE